MSRRWMWLIVGMVVGALLLLGALAALEALPFPVDDPDVARVQTREALFHTNPAGPLVAATATAQAPVNADAAS